MIEASLPHSPATTGAPEVEFIGATKRFAEIVLQGVQSRQSKTRPDPGFGESTRITSAGLFAAAGTPHSPVTVKMRWLPG